MEKILNYKILSKFEETISSIIYKARKNNENKTYIIKEQDR